MGRPTSPACGRTLETIARKLAYVQELGLGGAFLWKFSSDTADGELISAVARVGPR